MKEPYRQKHETAKKRLRYKDGRLYFTKDAERSFYFVLTLIMLVAGILYKIGIL